MIAPIKLRRGIGKQPFGTLIVTPPLATATTSGSVWQFVATGNFAFDQTSSASVVRAFVSSAAILFTEAGALSRTRAFTVSTAFTFAETSTVQRLRTLPAATATAIFSESSALGRLQRLAASAVSAVWTESSTSTRIRGFVGTSAATFTETAALSRLRRGVSAAAMAFSETAALGRIRAFVGNASASFSESSTIRRIRQFTATGAAIFAESATLARLRGSVSSVTAQWAETAALSRKRQFVSSAGFVFGQLASFGSGSTVQLAAQGAFAFSEASALSRKRQFVSAVRLHRQSRRAGRRHDQGLRRASSGGRDAAGEIVQPEAMKAALPDYSRFPALREMHQPLAAGKVLEADVDGDGVTNIVAHVVDPLAVHEGENGVYAGFSIGGKVTAAIRRPQHHYGPAARRNFPRRFTVQSRRNP
jgi:hypothetical protein